MMKGSFPARADKALFYFLYRESRMEYIVTEYGVACLKWKSLAERVKELIRIAHPDFRYQLKFAAAKNHWI
jgi:4-hydroxybutyrate CoA-transferase